MASHWREVWADAVAKLPPSWSTQAPDTLDGNDALTGEPIGWRRHGCLKKIVEGLRPVVARTELRLRLRSPCRRTASPPSMIGRPEGRPRLKCVLKDAAAPLFKGFVNTPPTSRWWLPDGEVLAGAVGRCCREAAAQLEHPSSGHARRKRRIDWRTNHGWRCHGCLRRSLRGSDQVVARTELRLPLRSPC